MLAPIRLTNAGSCPSRQRDCVATAARSAETKGTALFLPVLPTPLRGYCYAVRQNERQLVLRTQVRRKETHPHPALLPPRPYAVRPEMDSSRQRAPSIPTPLAPTPPPPPDPTPLHTPAV